jgi:MoaD family protein
MRIRVSGYLTLRGTIGSQTAIDLETERTTLKDLLQKLSLEFGDDIVPPISDLNAFRGPSRRVVILLNGRHSSRLPDGLDTSLADGDEVAIFPPVAGG